jgi:hypothetical protein
MSVQIFVIRSDLSPVPLAEVRTDGKSVEFVVDNSNGELPKVSQGLLQNLRSFCGNSSHLTMEQSSENIAHFVRYMLNNGEVVELSTDHKTVLINGKLLDEQHKEILFDMIRTGEVKVTSSSNEAYPVPSIPAPKPAQPASTVSEHHVRIKTALQLMKQEQARRDEMMKWSSPDYDPEIESADFSSMDNYGADFTKKLWYFMRYGDQKNGRN